MKEQVPSAIESAVTTASKHGVNEMAPHAIIKLKKAKLREVQGHNRNFDGKLRQQSFSIVTRTVDS